VQGAMNEEHYAIERRLVVHQPLAPLTTLGVGGGAEYYFLAETADDLVAACGWANQRQLPIWILSGGSNLVVADAGVPGLIIDVQLRGMSIERKGSLVAVKAAAGEVWDELVDQVVKRGHHGLEGLSGIPGRVGATPIQNVGAYGQDVAQSIVGLEAYDRLENAVVAITNEQCEFDYRTSRFRAKDRGRFIIMSVSFRLTLDGAPRASHAELKQRLDIENATAQQVRDAVLALRRSKSMLFDRVDPWSRSCGSFFLNPIVPAVVAERIQLQAATSQAPIYPLADGMTKIAAAWLIERAGFSRGHRDGAVGLSEKHSLAIVARNQATARDVCRFARRIQAAVMERFNVELLPEPVFWGFGALHRGLPDPDEVG
jgi:UDP-N-acetylmuramate dehydrogenase